MECFAPPVVGWEAETGHTFRFAGRVNLVLGGIVGGCGTS
jgi:hypothetical protein